MSMSGRAVIRHLDEAERFILVRRERAILKSEMAHTAKQHRRANKQVKRAFDLAA